MSNSISVRPSVYQLMVSDTSSAEMAGATKTELKQARRLREADSTLEAVTYGRFNAHLGALGERTAF